MASRCRRVGTCIYCAVLLLRGQYTSVLSSGRVYLVKRMCYSTLGAPEKAESHAEFSDIITKSSVGRTDIMTNDIP